MTNLEEDAPLNHIRRRNISFLAIVAAALTTVGIIIYLLSRGKRTEARDIAAKYYASTPQCFEAPINPRDRRENKRFLKILNFNPEWLFLYGGRGGIRCPTNACPWGNIIEALNHMKTVADLLIEIDADMVHLNEIEDCRVLNMLLTYFPQNHRYKPYLLVGKDHATGQNTAILTRIDPSKDLVRTERRARYPSENSKCSRSQTGTIGVTKHYLASFNIDNGNGERIPFVFVGLHFLARPTDKTRCAQREAQAMVIRDLTKSMSVNSERVIIMGDFNDYDNNAIGVDNRRPITDVLKILYGSSGSGRNLTNAASLIAQEQRYTCWFDVNQNCRVDGDKEKVMIDHILFDSSLKVVRTEIIHNDDPTCDKRISDHWPFSVTFDLST